ncbi:flagellar biosynthetic protein FliO [Acerihabitans sp. TG2]|uniref:flagellar biosynthetic protein FliO n=1 Tax=Acerihabitans sp. TG2 TaxID=3096008 RepID=UPI002B230382|nr:flagellar biosynthetic protein FliO [Acerihabitans sp. TG2]MEA9392593.1 flagellar biosynthetic protein FliO [Acerihabitans sp. TG2]
MSTTQSGTVTAVVAEPAPAFSAAGALTQVGGALGGILLLIIIGAWIVRKLGLAPVAKRSGRLTLQASCALGQREKVVIVQVEGTWLVLGVTAQQITPLHTLPAPPDLDEPTAATEMNFRQRLRQVMGHKDERQ